MISLRRLLPLIMLTLAGCGFLGGNSYRFRMTVAVDTPQGVRTGSSVYEVTAGRTGGILPEEAKRDWSVKGEAVAVDLPGGRTLFALLKTGAHFEDMMGLSMASLHPDFRGTGYDVVGVAKELSRGTWPGPAEVAPADYPMLVMFADKDDLASVQLVEPGNLGGQFGDGVRLRGMIVELTDNPVTTIISMRLKRIGIENGHGLDRTGGVNPNPTLGQRLSFNDFAKK